MKWLLPIIVTLAVAGCVGVKGSEVVSLSEMDKFGPLPQFDFASHDGGRVTADGLKGKVAVIDFFFSNCKGVCPTMTSNMRTVREAFRDDNRVQCVSITVDPGRDDTKRLKVFWKQYGGLAYWSFLTGSKKAVYKLAREGLKLGTSEVPGDFLHSERFVLVDQTGEVRGYYRGSDLSDIERIQKDIRSLLK